MNRRLRIIMDHNDKIKPDARTNWVCSNDINMIEWNIRQAQNENRGTLVLRTR
jgi:hypothetical protein